jgi:hypothetical protein
MSLPVSGSTGGLLWVGSNIRRPVDKQTFKVSIGVALTVQSAGVV